MEGIFTDITIRCHDGKEFKVHKIVVCPQSRFFHNAFKPGSLSKVNHPFSHLSFF